MFTIDFLTGVEFIDTADLVEKVCDLFGRISSENLHLFLVYEVSHFLHHFVFGRDDIPVEHVLVVLVVIVVDFFFQTTHDIDALENFLRQLR
jgi:hypothetical protein